MVATKFIAIGIIKDTKENLTKDYDTASQYVKGKGCCLASSGEFIRGSTMYGKEYMDKFDNFALVQ